MESFLYTNPLSISTELCKDIINLYEKQIDGKYEGVTQGGLNKDHKNTTDFVITKSDEKWYNIHNFLTTELQRNVIKYMNILNTDKYIDENNPSNTYKVLRFKELVVNTFMMQRYIKEQGIFVYHSDNSIDYVEKKYRVVTFLWYLNTVEEGGETEFWGQYKIKPEVGKLLLFPACWTFPHCGKRPLSDNKYIITGWLYVME